MQEAVSTLLYLILCFIKLSISVMVSAINSFFYWSKYKTNK